MALRPGEATLDEAIALLRECAEQMGFDDTELGMKVGAFLAFLTSAPAGEQPIAQHVLREDCEMSAKRAESAEATLAAVREALMATLEDDKHDTGAVSRAYHDRLQLHLTRQRDEYMRRAESAESTLAAAQKLIDNTPRCTDMSTLLKLLHDISDALSATPVPQHPDSALLDQIAALDAQCKLLGSHDGFLEDLRALLRTRGAGQSGAGRQNDSALLDRISARVRERQMLCEPQDCRIQSENDSICLRAVEALLRTRSGAAQSVLLGPSGEVFAKITSVRVETKGAHDHVSVFVDGKLSGVLVVDAGDGEKLSELLWWGAELQERAGAWDSIQSALDRV